MQMECSLSPELTLLVQLSPKGPPSHLVCLIHHEPVAVVGGAAAAERAVLVVQGDHLQRRRRGGQVCVCVCDVEEIHLPPSFRARSLES